MWNLNLDKIASLVPGGPGEIAIESGTCRGNGAIALAKRFKKVITIELSPELHCEAQQRFHKMGISEIEALRGNSPEIFEKILPALHAEPIFFFLDAHWSGDSSVDWSRSDWKGYGIDTAHLGLSMPTPQQQCPLAEELRAIVESCRGPAFILVDDMKNIPAQGPGLKNQAFSGEDWSHLSRDLLLKIVEPRLTSLNELSEPDQWLMLLAGLSDSNGA